MAYYLIRGKWLISLIHRRKKKYDDSEFRQKLSEWLVASDQPFAEVESVFFRRIINCLQPQASTFSAVTIRNDIVANFEQSWATLKENLSVEMK